MSAVSDFILHCFAESGNAYKVALLMEVSRLDWTPVDVDFFNGKTRTAGWRESVNEMGEVPVLIHDGLRLTQSGVMLHYLSDLLGKYGGRDEAEKREIWRWILFDNHRFTSYFVTHRWQRYFARDSAFLCLAYSSCRSRLGRRRLERDLTWRCAPRRGTAAKEAR